MGNTLTEAVLDSLTMLNIRSGNKLSGDHLALLALEYVEDFEDDDVSAAEFDLAYRKVRKEANGYIPNSGRFLEVIRAERERPRDVPQLTDGSEAPLSPEELARNRRRAQAMLDHLAGKISVTELNRLMAEA